MSFGRRLLLVTRYSSLVTLAALVGCGQQPPAGGQQAVAAATPNLPADPPPAPAAPRPPAPKPPQPKPPEPKPPEPPPEFKFPPDTGGQALAKALTPLPPPPPPVERFGTAPAGRIPPTKVVTPEPLAKVTYAPPPLSLTKAAGLKPTSPAERVPLDLGVRAGTVPQRPKLPETPGITTKARDVNQPPDLPPLGRQLPDRASLDDPTAEPGNAAVVNRPVNVPLLQSGFLRVAIPDPFELAGQVKPKVPHAAEPGLLPVPVSPPRPK
jgi:hypothetical protein